MIEEPTLGMLATVSGVGLLTNIVTSVIVRAWQPSEADKDRFGPLLALVVGVFFGVGGALAAAALDPLGFDPGTILVGLLTGIVATGVAMGLHSAGQKMQGALGR